jgi:hypothetical protein
MSLLSLCWHNKTLLPANCLEGPVSQLANSCLISWSFVIQDCWDGELSPPLSPGCFPQDCQKEIPPGANWQLDPDGDSSSWQVRVRASDAQWNSVRHRNQWEEGSTAHQTGKNLGSNSPRRQKGSFITSQWDILVTAFFRVKPHLSGSGSGMEVLCCVIVYKNVSWDTAQLRIEWGVTSCSVSISQSGNGRRWAETSIRTLPWSVWLITLKRNLMQTTELSYILTSQMSFV